MPCTEQKSPEKKNHLEKYKIKLTDCTVHTLHALSRVYDKRIGDRGCLFSLTVTGKYSIGKAEGK